MLFSGYPARDLFPRTQRYLDTETVIVHPKGMNLRIANRVSLPIFRNLPQKAEDISEIVTAVDIEPKPASVLFEESKLDSLIIHLAVQVPTVDSMGVLDTHCIRLPKDFII